MCAYSNYSFGFDRDFFLKCEYAARLSIQATSLHHNQLADHFRLNVAGRARRTDQIDIGLRSTITFDNAVPHRLPFA